MSTPTSYPTPIIAKPADRDPLRNFKFRVQFVRHADPNISNQLANMGFISVSGISVQTDTIPYREGGDNVSMRKMPGQSDFAPLTLIGGVFAHPTSPQYEWFKQIFALQWGKGNAAFNDDFRCDAIVSVLKHPVTKFSTGGVGDPNSQQSAGAVWRFYNCWPSALQYNDLNAGDNSIMISNMTLQHEGWDAKFGDDAQNPQW